MAQRSFGSSRRNRQYEKIKSSVRRHGGSLRSAKRIAAATTNRTRRAKGEVRGRSKARRKINRTRAGARRAMKAAGRKGGRSRKRSRR